MTNARRPTVLVAMSGGVDSSVAAALLAERGYDVIGATLKLWCYEEREPSPRACCSLEAIADARSIAVRLGLAHYVLDYTEPFRERVIDPFVRGYLAGRTPYPCAACNADLKFGRLVEQARAIGAEFVATGHYVRRGEASHGEPALFRAAHAEKDQSFALWQVARETLPSLLFPLGELSKDQVRREAERLGLARVASKEESQDLCFVGAGGYAAFVAQEASQAGASALRPGPIFDSRGREVGEHAGLARYTVGQRRGLGREIGRASGGGPLYVLALEPETNALRVGPADALLASEIVTGPVHWQAGEPPRPGECVDVQIRYRGPTVAARLCPPDGAEFDSGSRVVLESPLRAVTPGQSAVFYQADRLLGGATIERAGGQGTLFRGR
jgi:tRNA-specific 2-thiouridylase